MDKYLKYFLLTLLLLTIIYFIINVYILYSKVKNALNDASFNSKFCQKERCVPTSSQLVQTLPLNIDVAKWQKDVAKYCTIIIYSIEKAGLDNVKPIYPTALVIQKEFYDSKNDPVFGAIFTEGDNIWISFRGTLSDREWKQDFTYKQDSLFHKQEVKQVQLDFLQSVQGKAPSVHKGFIDVYMNFRDELLNEMTKLDPGNTKNIIISGHSLGAAISTLVGVDLAQSGYKNVCVYNFASPRIGDDTFKNVVDNMYGPNLPLPVYRLVNISDIAPNMPPSVSPNFDDTSNPYMYVHCGALVSFQQNRLSVLNNHLIPSYMEGLEKNNLTPVYME